MMSAPGVRPWCVLFSAWSVSAYGGCVAYIPGYVSGAREPRASLGRVGRVPGSACVLVPALSQPELSHQSTLAVLTFLQLSTLPANSQHVTPGAREPRALHGGLLRHR